MRRPFNGAVNITTEYGVAQASRRGYHTGVDYAMPVGTEILAPEGGTIVRNGDGTGSTDGRGYFIVMKGNSGTFHQLFHLQKMGNRGGGVSEGEVIGYSGNSGRSSGPHLHWETTKADDRNSDFAPSQWLFKGQPVYLPPTNVPAPTTQFVRLFGDYRTLRSSPNGTARAKIYPNTFGHLDYAILERSGDSVKIQTQMYGQGWIYVGADVASLTQYFNA